MQLFQRLMTIELVKNSINQFKTRGVVIKFRTQKLCEMIYMLKVTLQL